MTKAAASPILHLIRRVVEDERVKVLPDQELLRRFSTERDEAAFAALLRRHGSMVLDICRNLLANEDDAEDAFQATFLVLAQRAWAIRKKSSVGSWLHGVAYRTALKAQAEFARRQKHEARAPGQPPAAPCHDLTWREVQQALHAELNRLSERYRAPLVLCYLEGKAQDEAALLLGVSRATVKKRLESGRAVLRVRLVRRGLGPAAVLAVAAWPAASVSAAVSSILVDSTVKAATSVAAGGFATSVVSATVAALTQGVLRTMFLSQLKATTAALVIGGLLLSGLLVAALSGAPQSLLAQQPAAEKKDKPADKGAPAKTADRLKVRMTFEGHGTGVYALAFSPDGKLLASGSDDGSIKIWNTTTGKEVKTLAAHQEVVSLSFSPDGKSLASTSHSFKFPNTTEPAAVRLWDVASWEEKVKLEDSDGKFRRPTFSPDGKVLAASVGWKDEFPEDRVILWDTSTGKQLGTLKDEKGRNLRAMVFSPDGKTLLLGSRCQPGDDAIRVWSWAEQKPNGGLKIDGECSDLRFTRDGKTLVTVNEHGEITFWDYESWHARKTVKAGTAPGWAGRPRGLALSPDEKLVALGYATMAKAGKYAGKVDLRDTESGELVATLALDTVVANVAFSPRGGMLAAGCLKDAQEERNRRAVWLQGKEGVVRIWDLQDPKK